MHVITSYSIHYTKLYDGPKEVKFMFSPKKLSSADKLKNIAGMLEEIIEDTTVPRNIRAAADNA